MPPRPDLIAAVTSRLATATREISLLLAVVLLVGLGAAQAAPPVTSPVADRAPLAARTPAPAPVEAGTLVGSARRPVDVEVPQSPRPAKKTAAVDSAAPAAPRLAPRVARWLPSGTGMWLHDWRRSEHGSAPHVVAKSQRSGLTHLYVQTGSSKKGWIGEEVLSELLPATRGTGISVIAWDFPKLVDPEGDARRMARAAAWQRPGVPRVAAVAPDVETPAEGAHYDYRRVDRYYATLRAALPAHIAILATVPWPSEKRIGRYPYGTTAKYADAWIPMAYWYNRSPSVVTSTSMTFLARYGKPVMPVGQGYDGRLDAPYLAPDPAPDKSVAAFALAARTAGARSISLWSWQTTGTLQWQVLVDQARHYAPGSAAPVVPLVRPSTAPPATPAKPADSGPRAPGRKPHRDRAWREAARDEQAAEQAEDAEDAAAKPDEGAAGDADAS